MASDDDILIVSGGFQMDASQQSIAETAAQFDDSIDNSKDLPYNAAHSSMFGSGQEAHHVGAGALNLSTIRSFSNNLMHWQVASYPYGLYVRLSFFCAYMNVCLRSDEHLHAPLSGQRSCAPSQIM